MTPPGSTPGGETFLSARTQESLNRATFDLLRTRLVSKLEGVGATPDKGVQFLVLDSRHHLILDQIVAPLLDGLGCEWVEVSARHRTSGKAVRVIFAGWIGHESYLENLAWLAGTHGWMSRSAFQGDEGPQILFQRSGIVLSERVYWNPIDFVPGESARGEGLHPVDVLRRAQGEDAEFGRSEP